MLIAETIAEAFADSALNADDMVEDATHDLSINGPWLRPLARRIKKQIEDGLPHDATNIRAAILSDSKFRKLFKTEGKDVPLPGYFNKELSSKTKPPVRRWKNVPKIDTFGGLADLLNIEWNKLHWLIRYQKNYHRNWFRKRSSGYRLIESPKPLLKSIQGKLLRLILNHIPVHETSHGFCRGRNVVSFAEPHVGKPCVLKFDLKDFFPTLRFGRVMGLFKSQGFREEVARTMAKLCTTRCPSHSIEVLRDESSPSQLQELRRLYLPAHLPQGAPSSPMLANLSAFRLDSRLAGLAAAHGANYTRYADDLLISGDRKLGRNYDWLASVVGAIALEEGFELNYRKSRMMKSSVRQHSAGVVLNAGTNISREQFDRLKAILHNCIQHGPRSQNRESHPDFRAHLAGKIAWITQLNSHRGAKLKRLFDQINW